MHPAVRADLELGFVPRGVGVRGPIHMAELGFRRRSVGLHVERERQFEQLLGLVPVDIDLDVQCGRAILQRDALHKV